MDLLYIMVIGKQLTLTVNNGISGLGRLWTNMMDESLKTERAHLKNTSIALKCDFQLFTKERKIFNEKMI